MGINKDQVEGRAKEAAGKVQEVAGKVGGVAASQGNAEQGGRCRSGKVRRCEGNHRGTRRGNDQAPLGSGVRGSTRRFAEPAAPPKKPLTRLRFSTPTRHALRLRHCPVAS